MSRASVEIVETGFVKLDRPTIIEGFPSVGLVGSIATEYIATKLDMQEIGFVRSDRLPPVTIVKDGIPKSPIRIYSKDNLVVFVSDTAIPESLTYELSREIVTWSKKHGASKIISIGGIAKDEKTGDSKVYVVGTSKDILAELSKKGHTAIKLGFLTGLLGVLLMQASEEGILAHAYLTEATVETPDPKAAAIVISAVSEELGQKIDTTSLMQTSEKLERKIGELLKQTKKNLDDHQTYPSIYG